MKRESLLSRLNEEEGQVLSYLLKIILVAVLVAVFIIEAGPIIWNHISTRGTANEAAELAAHSYANNRGDMEKVRKEVKDFVEERQARLVGDLQLVYDNTGRATAIKVTVRKIVNTYLFEHIGYLSPLTEARATGKYDLF